MDLSAAIYINNVDSYSWEQKNETTQGTQDIQDNSWGYNISNNSVTDWALLHYGTSGHFTAHSGEIIETGDGVITDESAQSEATSDSSKVAVWFNVQFDIGDNIEFIPGIRYDRFTIKSPNAIGLDEEPLLRDGRTEQRVSKSLSALYHLNDNVQFFASYAQAINNPRNGELFTSGRGFKPNPELKSERADNKELGIVFDYQDVFGSEDTLVTRVNVFQNDIKDFITDIYSEEYEDGEKVNIGEAQLKGFEITTSYRLNDLDLLASYGRTRGIDKNTGWYLTEIPSDKINAMVNYHVSDQLSAGTSLTYAFSHDAVPTKQLSTDGEEDIPAEGFGTWFTMDLFATYQPQSMSGLITKLSVTNLFDRGYAQRTDYERNGDPKAAAEYFEEGRSINLSLSYIF